MALSNWALRLLPGEHPIVPIMLGDAAVAAEVCR